MNIWFFSFFFENDEYLNLNCLFTIGDTSVCKFNVVKLVVTITTQGDRNIGGVMLDI